MCDHTVVHGWLVCCSGMQFGQKKKPKARGTSEPVFNDPELDAKLGELDSMKESQINDKLQTMLVSQTSLRLPDFVIHTNCIEQMVILKRCSVIVFITCWRLSNCIHYLLAARY